MRSRKDSSQASPSGEKAAAPEAPVRNSQSGKAEVTLADFADFGEERKTCPFCGPAAMMGKS
jgi:hypothetical protein